MYKKTRIDFTIICSLLILGFISTLLIYSATQGTKFAGLHVEHGIFFSILFVFMIVLSYVRLKDILYPSAYVLYGIGLVLLLLVPFIGIDKHGAVRWLDLGFFDFQPSELMKIFLVILLSRFLARRDGLPLRFRADLIPAFAFMLVPLALIYKQPDM